MKKLISFLLLAAAFVALPAPAAAYKPGLPTTDSNPLPVSDHGFQETFQLVAANVPSAQVAAYGGNYIFSQVCSTYGTLTLQVLGPDGATFMTMTSKTAADTTGGTAVQLGSGAVVKGTVSGTTGCNALLSRIP